MYNSYYHLSPYKSVEHMPQLYKHYRSTKTLWDTLANSYSSKASLTYKSEKKYNLSRRWLNSIGKVYPNIGGFTYNNML